VQSQEGIGSTFSFTIQAVQKQEEEEMQGHQAANLQFDLAEEEEIDANFFTQDQSIRYNSLETQSMATLELKQVRKGTSEEEEEEESKCVCLVKKGNRILVVDDDPFVHFMLKEMILNSFGQQVDQALDGGEAVSIIGRRF